MDREIRIPGLRFSSQNKSFDLDLLEKVINSVRNIHEALSIADPDYNGFNEMVFSDSRMTVKTEVRVYSKDAPTIKREYTFPLGANGNFLEQIREDATKEDLFRLRYLTSETGGR